MGEDYLKFFISLLLGRIISCNHASSKRNNIFEKFDFWLSMYILGKIILKICTQIVKIIDSLSLLFIFSVCNLECIKLKKQQKENLILMGVFQFSIQSNKKYMNKINVQREGYTGIPRTKPHMRFFGINKSLNSINSFF